ncbi:hypothetical protein HAX54_001663, partial [Datura stramonium]|nr:hypothetical protein [Datura stramonium]
MRRRKNGKKVLAMVVAAVRGISVRGLVAGFFLSCCCERVEEAGCGGGFRKRGRKAAGRGRRWLHVAGENGEKGERKRIRPRFAGAASGEEREARRRRDLEGVSPEIMEVWKERKRGARGGSGFWVLRLGS